MDNKPKTSRLYWRIIAVFFSVLGGIIIGSVLSSAKTMNFLNAQVSWTSYVLMVAVTLLVILYLIRRLRHKKSYFLEFPAARKLALLCQTPRSTRFLRILYTNWEKQYSVANTETDPLADFLKEQEKEGVLKYSNGKWQLTKKGLEVIANELLYDTSKSDT